MEKIGCIIQRVEISIIWLLRHICCNNDVLVTIEDSFNKLTIWGFRWTYWSVVCNLRVKKMFTLCKIWKKNCWYRLRLVMTRLVDFFKQELFLMFILFKKKLILLKTYEAVRHNKISKLYTVMVHKLNTHLNWSPVFEWCQLGVELRVDCTNKMFVLKEIGLFVPKLLSILSSIANIFRWRGLPSYFYSCSTFNFETLYYKHGRLGNSFKCCSNVMSHLWIQKQNFNS